MGKKRKWSKQSKDSEKSIKSNRFLDPSILAQHAALARQQSQSISLSSTRKERKDSIKSKPKTNESKNESKMKVKKRKQEKIDKKVQENDENTNKDELFHFGNPKWRNIEQLCHIVLFHSFHSIVSTLKCECSCSVIVVFMSDLEQMKEYSSVFKPVIHPSLSIAFHKKIPKTKIKSIIEKYFHTKQIKENISNDSIMNTNILFIHDDCLSIIISICNSINKNTKQYTNVKFVHYHSPPSNAISKLRRHTAHAFGNISSDSKKINLSTINHIILDGTNINPSITNKTNSLHSSQTLLNLSSHFSISKSVLSMDIPKSDRNIIQAIMNHSMRIYISDVGSAKQISAKEKLMANLIHVKHIWKQRMQEKQKSFVNQKNINGNTNQTIQKMKIIGMIYDQQHLKNNKKGRQLAMTRWLDEVEGHEFGATWKGSIRYGASLDESSKALASHRYSASSSQNCQNKTCLPISTHNTNSSSSSSSSCWFHQALYKWKPNLYNGNPYRFDDKSENHTINEFSDQLPATKACSHNETSMFYLRPFAPIEVLNSRVCSISSPAPGNDGFEGCLDFLRRACAESKRGMYYLDNESISYINGRKIHKNGKAKVLSLKKERLLHLDVKSLTWLEKAIRQWIIFRYKNGWEGCDPFQLILGIQKLLNVFQLGNNTTIHVKTKRSIFPSNVLQHIMYFVLPDTPKDWSVVNIQYLNK